MKHFNRLWKDREKKKTARLRKSQMFRYFIELNAEDHTNEYLESRRHHRTGGASYTRSVDDDYSAQYYVARQGQKWHSENSD